MKIVIYEKVANIYTFLSKFLIDSEAVFSAIAKQRLLIYIWIVSMTVIALADSLMSMVVNRAVIGRLMVSSAVGTDSRAPSTMTTALTLEETLWISMKASVVYMLFLNLLEVIVLITYATRCIFVLVGLGGAERLCL